MQLDCPKCGAKLEWEYAADARALAHAVSVDVTFYINCPACGWSAEVSETNSVTQEELNEIYFTETEDGD